MAHISKLKTLDENVYKQKRKNGTNLMSEFAGFQPA